MFRFHKRYFLLSFSLLLVEILIALYVRDEFIRPYFGDFLAVIWLYCTLKAFVNLPVKVAATCVLLFAYALETAQHFQLVKVLGLSHSRFFNVLIGNRFEWVDMAAYTLGIATVILLEGWKKKTPAKTSTGA
ncbi:DUF2809 domain-containing protein [Chitinophaga sedimenti]|uniref:ribosomal maturation YjgA family protein n=1 Tax=Chitinophaga sedimenti TaxID=2033606 RepID=UPI002003AD8C|nr:DUF2809 domain-containing protein [Chitinophaga sedimenti]MCK7556069.1 DUF2809 domain-containing protein [Chitinophaga sedimenti]